MPHMCKKYAKKNSHGRQKLIVLQIQLSLQKLAYDLGKR